MWWNRALNDNFLKIRSALLIAFLLSVFAFLLPFPASGRDLAPLDTIAVAELPPEARQTLAAIERGGPFPYPKDGVVFGNYEKILPLHKRGYYREYTVRTPYARNRGAKRIIAGGEPAHEFFYTSDHYASFRRIEK
ncbi:MAG: ribonuclease [Herbaspirillum sp.]|nr:ribonuclease [Herbaspirillum sp.]